MNTIKYGFILAILVVIAAFGVKAVHAEDLTAEQVQGIFAVAYGQVGGSPSWLDTPPAVYMVTQRQLCERIDMDEDCPVPAIYLDGRVYVDETLDFSTPLAATILAHEFVHYFQDMKYGGPVTNCDDWLVREREAYMIQTHLLERLDDYTNAASVRRMMSALTCN